MKRMLLVLAVVLVMAAVAAPSVLARTQFWCYRASGEVEVACFPSKESCEQARAADQTAISEKCVKAKKI